MGTFDQAPVAANPLDNAYASSVFDQLMNSTCDILEKGQTGSDSYGQPASGLTTLMTGQPCRISQLSGGREWEAKKRYALNEYLVFMRPPTSNGAGSYELNGQLFPITARHWLRVYRQDGTEVLINLKVVNDPSGLGNHLECHGEEIIP